MRLLISATVLATARAEIDFATLLPKVKPAVAHISVKDPQGNTIGIRDNGAVLQITAPISPGSSGSSVLNAEGKVVGVATAFLSGGQNLNLAVSVSKIMARLADARRRESAQPFGASAVGTAAGERLTLEPAEDLYLEKRYSEAAKMLREVLEKNPNSVPALYALALVWWEMGLRLEALNAAQQALNLEPGNLQIAERYALWMADYNDISPSMERMRLAYDAIARAIALGTTDRSIWNFYAIATRHTQSKQAAKQVDDLIQLQMTRGSLRRSLLPQDPRLWFGHVVAFAEPQSRLGYKTTLNGQGAVDISKERAVSVELVSPEDFRASRFANLFLNKEASVRVIAPTFENTRVYIPVTTLTIVRPLIDTKALSERPIQRVLLRAHTDSPPLKQLVSELAKKRKKLFLTGAEKSRTGDIALYFSVSERASDINSGDVSIGYAPDSIPEQTKSVQFLASLAMAERGADTPRRFVGAVASGGKGDRRRMASCMIRVPNPAQIQPDVRSNALERMASWIEAAVAVFNETYVGVPP
jgi:tetratricopeptide (TPR) repeat protein